MTLEFDQEGQLKFNRFSRLGTWYILALSVIVTIAIVGQILIQNHLDDQLSDSHVINVAGRQRMLSQRITKIALLLKPVQEEADRKEILEGLMGSLHLWVISHKGLQEGNDSLHLPGQNSDKVKAMFSQINDHHEAMKAGATVLMNELLQDPLVSYDILHPHIETILLHQDNFLSGMNDIVFQYDAEARQKVSKLSKLEYGLLLVSIIVILLEIFFVFRPTTIQVNQTVNQLMSSEKNARKLSKEIGALYSSLEKSYEELSHVNVPVETPKIYAKTDRGGNVIFVSDQYHAVSGKKLNGKPMTLTDLFEGSRATEEWMEEVIERLSEGTQWQGIMSFVDANGKDHWSDLTIVPALSEEGEVDEWVVLGSDITLQKFAEQNMREKNKAEVEKKINQQKFRSVLILEGQEEERKRLAMDIHDGIGQMLTSLKFQIESIDPHRNADALSSKLSEIQQLIGEIIKEVRKVTFNLKPTVLGDFGLQAALNVFIKEIGKLTDIQLVYRSSYDEPLQLPQKVENNIFRIIQEAVNNAIKYSGASYIEVLLQRTASDIVLTVTDNGKGFDEEMVEARSVNIDSGRGFFNMYERTEYVNGKLEIKSNPGQGTAVILTVPVKSPAIV